MFVTPTKDKIYFPKRIISVVPSQTELLAYLGLENETIGITKFCIHPSHWRSKKTIIGGTKNLHIEKIISLKPDLIICNKEENVQEHIEALAEKFPVYMSDVSSYEDALVMIKEIGMLTGKLQGATKLIESIANVFAQLETIQNNKINASYLIWKDPYMTAGGQTFISSMMEKAGFNNVFAALDRYPTLTVEALQQSNPTCILLSSEPYPFNEKDEAALKKLFPHSTILLVDGEMFSWYGNRMLLAAGYFKTLQQQFCP